MQLAAQIGESGLVAGTVRISTSEGLGAHVIAPGLPELRRRHPGLKVELVALPGFMSPVKREVDMAVTLSAPASQRLLVEPLTFYELGLYASRAYLAEAPPIERPEDLAAVDLVGYIDDLIYAAELRYLQAVAPRLTCRLSSSSIRAQREIVAAAGGVGILPCFMAEGLIRVLPHIRLRRQFWLSSHRDGADTARVRAVRAWLKELVRQRADLLVPPDLPAGDTPEPAAIGAVRHLQAVSPPAYARANGR
jgi:DNA-binding transcriptional LysR family regulator